MQAMKDQEIGSGYTVSDMLRFYQEAVSSGDIKKPTGDLKIYLLEALINNRLLALDKDIRSIDLEQLIQNATGFYKSKNYKPYTVTIYESRIKKLFKDFLNVKSDPMFKFPKRASRKVNKETGDLTSDEELAKAKNMYHFFVPMRGGKIQMSVCDVPCDLDRSEAKKTFEIIQTIIKANRGKHEIILQE